MNAPQKTIMNANLFSRLFDGLDDPARLAIETIDGQRISYGDLIARAGQMANLLVSSGVKPGDRVAAQTEKSVPGLVLYLAVVRAGERVRLGDVLGAPAQGTLGARIHASIDGVVTSVNGSVVIESHA